MNPLLINGSSLIVSYILGIILGNIFHISSQLLFWTILNFLISILTISGLSSSKKLFKNSGYYSSNYTDFSSYSIGTWSEFANADPRILTGIKAWIAIILNIIWTGILIYGIWKKSEKIVQIVLGLQSLTTLFYLIGYGVDKPTSINFRIVLYMALVSIWVIAPIALSQQQKQSE